MAFLRQGKRSFAGELWAEDSTPTFLGKLMKSRCVDFGIYIVDTGGNLIGSEVDGFLYPIPVDNASWDPKFMFATDGTTQKLMVNFDFDRLFDESTMYTITADEASQDFNTLEGLIDVNITVVSISATAMNITAKYCYGTALNKTPYKGAIVGTDWTLTDTDTPAPVAIDSVVETADGEYTIDFTTAGLGSGVNLNIATNKDGFIGDADTVTP
jgi:hypothetical protein